MHEYRMTYVVRILSAITLIPTGVFCIYAGIDAANRKLSTGTVVTSYGVGLAFLLATALVWAHCIKKQVVLNDRSISMTSLFGTKVINIERGTRITHDSVDSLGVKGTAFGGIVGGAVGGLATGLLEAAASTQGEAATKNIKITLANEKARIELNSNIKGIAALRDKLIEMEQKYIFPDMKSRFANGERLLFGSVVLNNGEILVGKKSLKILELASIEIIGDSLLLKTTNQKGATVNIRTKSIDNMYSFLALLTQTAPKAVA